MSRLVPTDWPCAVFRIPGAFRNQPTSRQTRPTTMTCPAASGRRGGPLGRWPNVEPVVHRNHPDDHVPGVPERFRPEEDPGEAHDLEDHDPPDAAAPDSVGELRQAEPLAARPAPVFEREKAPVDGAPDDERPRGAVPQSPEQEGEEEVAVRPRLTAAVADDRDVDVVAEPARQRQLPSSSAVLEG